MRTWCRLLAYLGWALLLGSPCLGAIPDFAWGDGATHQNAPLWVSEEAAVVDQELQRQHFSDATLARLDSIIDATRPHNEEGCVVTLWTDGRQMGRFKGVSAQEILRRSGEVVTGTVTDVQQGFLAGEPGTMIEVRPDPVKGKIDSELLYLFLDSARIAVEGTLLCNNENEREPPKAGGSLVLALDDPLSSERIQGRMLDGAPILLTRPNEVLAAGALPKRYRDLAIDVEALRGQLHGWPPQ